MSNREKLAFGLAVASIVVVPGLASALLNALGAPTLGSLIWVIGYGSGILAIWYLWIRPLDIHAPRGRGSEESDRDA